MLCDWLILTWHWPTLERAIKPLSEELIESVTQIAHIWGFNEGWNNENNIVLTLWISLHVLEHEHETVSFKSRDECKDKIKQVTCLSSEDRCAKANFKAESSADAVEVFVKEWMTSSGCSADNCKSIYPSVKITKCEIDCCTGDLSNGAQVPMVSDIMLLACAIVPFAR